MQQPCLWFQFHEPGQLLPLGGSGGEPQPPWGTQMERGAHHHSLSPQLLPLGGLLARLQDQVLWMV